MRVLSKILLVSAAVVLLSGASPAMGAPSETTMGESQSSAALDGNSAERKAAKVCAGKAAKILKETDRKNPYLHFGGIQQCSTATEQRLTVMLDRWTGAKWSPTRRVHSSKVAFTLTAYSEPRCSSGKSTRYRVRVYGSAEGGAIIAKPYPYVGDPTTVSCYVKRSL